MLVRTWNLFNGNAVPPGRRAYLDEMVARAAADDPDVLCLQEVPAWALGRFTASTLACRPSLGPLPIPAGLGRLLTDVHHGLLRSAFAGQGNAIRLAARHELLARDELVLNPRAFRERVARELGLSRLARLAWGHERRTAHTVRFRAADGRTFLVANAHCTSFAADRRLADAELRRAASFARSAAAAGDVVVLAGDFNVTRDESATLAELATGEWRFSPPGPGIDQVLVHGAAAGEPQRLPDGWRRHGDVLLSDHAPVQVEIE